MGPFSEQLSWTTPAGLQRHLTASGCGARVGTATLDETTVLGHENYTKANDDTVRELQQRCTEHKKVTPEAKNPLHLRQWDRGLGRGSGKAVGRRRCPARGLKAEQEETRVGQSIFH